jgi:hypothetical protein
LITRFARERNSGESVSPICFAEGGLMSYEADYDDVFHKAETTRTLLK